MKKKIIKGFWRRKKKASTSSTCADGGPTIRKTVVDEIARVFCEGDAEKVDADRVAIQVEAAMMEKFGTEHSDGYKDKFRTPKFNLKGNGVLRSCVLSGAIGADELIGMSAQELATQERRDARNVAASKKFDGARSDFMQAKAAEINKMAGIKNAKGMFKCGRCKSTKTTHYQQQTRSADEPMTVFITCTECGNRWKQ